MFDVIDGRTIVKYDGNDKDIVIPEGIEYIGTSVFSKTDIERVTFPQSLKGIGNFAFSECKHLSEIVIPSGVLFVGARAFEESGVKEATIPSTIKCFDLYRTRVQGASGLFTNCRELKKLTITGKYDDEIQAGNWHKDELNEYSKHCLYSVPTPGSFIMAS